MAIRLQALSAGDGSLIDPNDHRIQIARAQLLADAVEPRQVLDRTDAHAVPDVAVHRDSLYGRIDPEFGELRMDAVGDVGVAIRPDLQEIDARAVDLGGGRDPYAAL